MNGVYTAADRAVHTAHVVTRLRLIAPPTGADLADLSAAVEVRRLRRVDRQGIRRERVQRVWAAASLLAACCYASAALAGALWLLKIAIAR